jgi:hypothetical protein
MKPVLILVALIALGAVPAPASANPVNTAFNSAIAALEAAAPRLGAQDQGVDLVAYRDALTRGQFSSQHWGGTVTLDLVESADASGSCSRFAAFVRLPPQNGVVQMVICPQFSAEGTAALRRLTVLHEMVHVVAGPDECRAMALAARIELLATGSFTPVDRYWQANGCDRSGFTLP